MSLGTCTDFTTELVCYDDGAGNKQTLVAHYEYGKSVIGSTILVSTRFTLPDGTVVDTSAGTVTMGACPVVPVQRTINHEAQNFAAGSFAASHDPLGNGASWVYPGAGLLQSVTVTVLEAGTPSSGNTVQVKQGAAGTVLHMVKGQTLTWSVAQDTMNEVLDPSFDISALGNAAFVVSWTEEL